MSWYEAVKDAVTAANKLQDADLIQRLATVQVECAALAEENARLREERNELRATLTARAETGNVSVPVRSLSGGSQR